MNVVDRLLYLLKTPSAFENDPSGFLRNQVGHIAVFGFAPCFIFGWAALPYAIAIYTAIELIQYRLFRSERWDGAQDWGFFALGAAFGLSHDLVVAAAAAAFLISGYWRRLDT